MGQESNLPTRRVLRLQPGNALTPRIRPLGVTNCSPSGILLMRLSRLISAALVVALAISPSLAAGKKNNDKHDATAAIKKKLAAADLPADVREKANKVVADDAPKLNSAQAKVDAILTTEQKEARKTALKEAKANGTKRRQAQAAIDAAVKLTSEQKSKLASAESELKSAQAALQKDLRAVLTTEQAEKVGLKAKKKNKA